MDVPSNNNKTLDGFYNELRRKYPDAFTLATDLGRRNGSLQKLPRLEKMPSPILGTPKALPHGWSPDSFLSKVKYQKTQNEQRKDVEKPQQSGTAVIIKDQAIPMPTWTRKDYLEAQNRALFHLPTLRTQIEQNKVELKNRLNLPKKTETNQSFTLQTSRSVQAKSTKDYTPTKPTRNYTTTKTSSDCSIIEPTTDYTSIQVTTDDTTIKTTKDDTTPQTTRDYTTTKNTKDDYTNTKISSDYTIIKPTKDLIATQTNRDYITTKPTKDYTTRHDTTIKPTKDYTTTETIRDYITTKSTKDYTTRHDTTMKSTKEYTTRHDTTIKATKNYTTTDNIRDYTTTKSIKDYTARYDTTIKPTKDYTIRDYITKKPIKDFTSEQTIGVCITKKPTKDYSTVQTIKNCTTVNDYTTKATRDYITIEDSSSSQTNNSGVKSDTLGTIMKELLPNKPSRLMKDLPETIDRMSNPGGCISDSDSAVSVCSPIKVFRPKIRSPQAPPASRDIIKKFSAKPQKTSEPLKADHSLVRENVTQIVQIERRPMTRYSRSSINFNEKIPQGPARARVHFEDESEEDAEFRYHERCLLVRTQTTKTSTNISPDPQIKYMDSNAKSETTEKEGEKPKSTDQQTMTLPHRRQPFPPNVAKKVLIDIPRGGLPSRRMPQIRVSPVTREITNHQMSPRNAASLDGITMCFTNTSQEWGEQAQNISAIKEDKRGHHSRSSLETLESGTSEVSSEFTIMKMEWGESNSSIGSGNQSRSSSENRDLNLNRSSQNKGSEMSFYSKVRRSFRLKKKLSLDTTNDSHHSDFMQKDCKNPEPDQNSYTSKLINRGVQEKKSSPHGATICNLSNRTAANDSISGRAGVKRMKDVMGESGIQDTGITTPVKTPYSPKKMMQSLLKKGRAKDYLVRVPSPPLQEARPTSSHVHSSRYRREQIPDQPSGRALAMHSDSSRLVELERPKMGFSGLYLTKKNQNGYSGLYVVQLSGAFTSSFPQGILDVGDEILEINRLQAKDLRLDEIYTLLEESSCVLLKVSGNISSSS